MTLAFTPYGSDPGKLAERARSQRHEILLQVPMEPFDYPDNDPGPQTLLTTLSPDQNLDRLYWHLSRFQGYAGIANFMGARFVAADAVMQPIVREAAKRGLGYLDDGSAPRSVAASLAAGQSMPFARADISIDAVPTAAEIDRALAKLEDLGEGARNCGRYRLGAADFDRADRRLDQDARKPRHHACAIDNRDAEIKIQLDRDDVSPNRHPDLSCCLSMIFSENRFPLFRIMFWISTGWRGPGSWAGRRSAPYDAERL